MIIIVEQLKFWTEAAHVEKLRQAIKIEAFIPKRAHVK
jgi:hypothetical protein